MIGMGMSIRQLQYRIPPPIIRRIPRKTCPYRRRSISSIVAVAVRRDVSTSRTSRTLCARNEKHSCRVARTIAPLPTLPAHFRRNYGSYHQGESVLNIVSRSPERRFHSWLRGQCTDLSRVKNLEWRSNSRPQKIGSGSRKTKDGN